MKFNVDLLVVNKPGSVSKVFGEFRKFDLTPRIVTRKLFSEGKVLGLRIQVEYENLEQDLLETHLSRQDFLKVVNIRQAEDGVSTLRHALAPNELSRLNESGKEDIIVAETEDEDEIGVDIFENYKGRRDKF